MLLIGGYTHYPVGIPAKAGEGVALFREENNTVEKIIPAENPSFLASDGSGGFFALKESDSGLLQHFVPNSSEGSFSSAAKIAFPGAGSCHLCVKDGKTVYVSNYLSGTLSVIGVTDTEMILLQNLEFSGSGPVEKRQEHSHIHSSILSESGHELFVADLGGDKIYRYAVEKDGSLTPFAQQPYILTPAGSGPRHMAWNKNILYVTAELSNEILSIRFDSDGIGSVVSEIQTTAEKGSQILTAHICFSESRNKIYACVRGTDEIVWLVPESDPAVLTLQGRCSSGGKFPRHFLSREREDKIYCANQLSSELTVFDLNAEGVPRLKCAVPMPGAAMVLSV